MHRITLLLLGTFAGHAVLAAELTVNFENIQGREGRIAVALYDSADSWTKTAIRDAYADIDAAGHASVRFDDLPPGDYAVSAYHDQNDNGKLDTRFKIPKEPYAFSNDASGRFGPPKFDAAKFALGDADQSVVIRFPE